MKFLTLFIPLTIILLFGKHGSAELQWGQSADSIKNDTVKITLLFSGDVMQHMPQVDAAWNDSCKCYVYDSTFKEIGTIFRMADISIINLETTLAGKPYSGYPQFTSPDEIVWGLKNAGIDIITTANNHSGDKGKKGVERTLEILDSAGMKHTGTFADSIDFEEHNPLMIDINGIRIALLSYTYGTNGIVVPQPAMINYIDTANIRRDFGKASELNADITIPFFHWGIEYQREQNEEQKAAADFCFDLGTYLVIGSHPHVVQPAQRYLRGKDTVTIAWSLGNFVSNQRQTHTDGGMLLLVEITKTLSGTFVSKAEYILHYVNIETDSTGKKTYVVLPVKPGKSGNDRMNEFAKNSRELLNGYEFAIKEMAYDTVDGKWVW